jgi:hypothetical protein
MFSPIRQASLKLDFIVIGAGTFKCLLKIRRVPTLYRIPTGIGGLATAFALARSGHHVRVFDKLDRSRQVILHARISKQTLLTRSPTKAVGRSARTPQSIKNPLRLGPA